MIVLTSELYILQWNIISYNIAWNVFTDES